LRYFEEVALGGGPHLDPSPAWVSRTWFSSRREKWTPPESRRCSFTVVVREEGAALKYTVHRWVPGGLQGGDAADAFQSKLNEWTSEEGQLLQVVQVLGASEGLWAIIGHEN